MRFKREKGLEVVDYCKYIDDNVYREDLTDAERDKILKYLYFIVYSISKHRKLFDDNQDYDGFAFVLAEWMYYRYYDPSKQTYDEFGNVERLKSVKNYVCQCINGRALAYRQKFKFSELLEDYHDTDGKYFGNFIDTALYKNIIKDSIDSEDRQQIVRLINGEIAEIPNIVWKICNTTQYKKDKQVVHNLYISCLLSFLNSMTLSNSVKRTIEIKKKANTMTPGIMSSLLTRNMKKPIILWHLDDNFTDYVKLLLVRIKKQFEYEIHTIINKFETTMSQLDVLLAHTIGGDKKRWMI